MTELKTLKELEYSEDGIVNLVIIAELRVEVIKWVKELDSEKLTISNGLVPTEEGYESYDIKNINKSALILWIKHFFNITKEDLK